MKKTKFHIILKWGALLGAGLSLIRLLHYFSRNIDYNFGPVFDLLMIVAFVGVLYGCIREYRDNCLDGIIKFTRAFCVGASVVLIAFLIVFLYLIFHYTIIEKDGIEKHNQRNIELAYQNIQKDTITNEEIKDYCQAVQLIIDNTAENLEHTLTPACDSAVQIGLNKITNSFTTQLTQKKRKPDDPAFRLDSFHIKSQELLYIITDSYLSNDHQISDSCCSMIPMIIANSQNEIDKIDPCEIRFERSKNTIPQNESISVAAFIYSISIIIYGIMIDIFVALFLYRKEKRICEMDNKEATSEDKEEKSEIK